MKILTICLLLVTSVGATDYLGRLSADEKGGDPYLLGSDSLVAEQDTPLGDVAAPNVADPLAGASAERSPLPDALAPPAFDPSQYVRKLRVGNKIGCCVYLGDGLFLTCAHVFLDNPEKRIHIDGKQYGGMRHVMFDVDLAFMRMQGIPEDWPACQALLEPLRPNQKVKVFGLVSGEHDGVINLSNRHHDGLVEIDFPENDDIMPGDSGGGIFNEQGQVVGIVSQDIISRGNNRAPHWGAICSPLVLEKNRFPQHRNILKPEKTAVPGVEFWLFSAAWCAFCRPHKDVILPQIEAAGYKVELIDTDEKPELASEYDILSLPTWVIIKDGNEVGRGTSSSTVDSLLSQIEKLR